jgi:hypothetical protein
LKTHWIIFLTRKNLVTILYENIAIRETIKDIVNV